MSQQVFLSHDSRDKALASAVAVALKRLSLGQISVWHSSDSSGHGGLRPGQVWLDEVRDQLRRSKAVVALLTPRSAARPWLLFEAGFGAGFECDVIPVCVGIDNLGNLPFPLAMYQTYQLADYESVKRFIEKLFSKYDVLFDEEMCQPILAELIHRLVSEPSDGSGGSPRHRQPSIEAMFDDLKIHIDKRMLELSNAQLSSDDERARASFEIPIDLRAFIKDGDDQYLRIDSHMSVQDVLDVVYYMIPEMGTFQYLRRWLLRDTATNVNLVIREVGARIPAHIVFQPGSRWEAVRLEKPYSPDDSQDHNRWYKP